MKFSVKPHYYLDEGLSPALAGGLQRFGFRCTRLPYGTPDQVSIERIGKADGKLGVWVSRDLASAREHRNIISESGVSVALIRDQNGTPAKHCFLVYNFVYQYQRVIANANEPLYFEVRERMIKGIPNAVVSKMEL